MDVLAANSPLLAQLNPPQREAVLHRDGPLLVLAGPGSGKTRVITHRAAALVHQGVMPWRILAITFTNKAAAEMRHRIEALGVGAGMWVYTFHALGVRLLRQFGPLVDVQPGFVIYDEPDQKRTVKEALEIAGANDRHFRPERVLGAISHAKNQLETPEEFAANAAYHDERTVARVYAEYEKLLRQRNAVDFDDLLLGMAYLLRDHPQVTEELNQRFRYLLIDEYQDTNHAQYLIARGLSKHHRNICVTGDPDQSIYAWRGADISNILEFEQDYPDAKVVRLEQNYRSTPSILRTASELIRCNRKRKHKDLWTENPDDLPVNVWSFKEGRDEAEQIAEVIAAQVQETGRAYSDFAVFYRVNAVSRGLEDALRSRRIPYKIARGVEFYNRKEIRDTLAYLRVLVNPDDDVALQRVINTPARGIGKTTLDRLLQWARRNGVGLMTAIENAADILPGAATAKKVRKFHDLLGRLRNFLAGKVSDCVGNVLTMSGLEELYRKEREEGGEDRFANLEELVSAAVRYEDETEEPTLEDFLSTISLASDQDQVDESLGVVLLMTLHAAKGLEFPVVFLVGLEQGLLPHERALGGDGDVEEERRLAFVGITRAKEQLYITHADQRYIRGALLPRAGSEFLRELPDDACVFERFGPPSWGGAGGLSGDPFAFGAELESDGFVPTSDHLSADETHRRPQKRTARRAGDFEVPSFSVDEPTGRQVPKPASAPNWRVGTMVEHKDYGIGQIAWLQPSPGQTRAGIRFVAHGEKTFILELAPVKPLGR